jgi:FkbM family methyltransferase
LIINYLRKKYPEDKQTIKEVVVNGCVLLVSVNESVGRQLYGLHRYEEENTKYIQKIVQPTWVCIDIGAHVGYYSLLFSRLAPEGQVHAFEANVKNSKLLELNVMRNSATNVMVNAVALDKMVGKRSLFITEDSGLTSFYNTERGKISQITEVLTITLDEYIKNKNLTRIDFIKMDVEGAEKSILEGSVNLLRVVRPKIILAELCPKNLEPFQESIDSVLGYLEQFQYVPYILKQGKITNVTKEQYGYNQDVYFIASESQGLFL